MNRAAFFKAVRSPLFAATTGSATCIASSQMPAAYYPALRAAIQILRFAIARRCVGDGIAYSAVSYLSRSATR